MNWPAATEAMRAGPWVAAAAALMLLIAMCIRVRGNRSSEVYKRGVLVESGAPAQRRGARLKKAGSDILTLGGVPIPALDETKHFKLIGTTGTGKSTAIRELLGAALARGDRAVFADPDGGYAARFFDRYRGDVVLNPFDSRSVKWDLFAEIDCAYDVQQLTSGLIATCDDASGNEWRGYARTFVAAIVRRCRLAGCLDTGELWRLLTVAPADELRFWVAGTPAQPFLDADNTRMFASIRSVAASAIAALEYIHVQRATPFSVRRWVRDRAPSGLLFIPYQASQIAALRSMIAAWMRLAIFEAMSQREDRDQRLWFVIDELDALGAIDGLKDALARLRKFGGRCVLGFQSIAQVSSTYGTGNAQTIIENCGNTLILRCSASEQGGTSQFASRLIGEREVLRRQTSRGSDREAGWSSRGMRRSKNISDQQVTEAAVMPSQLEQLPDLAGYFKGASARAWLKISFPSGGSCVRSPR